MLERRLWVGIDMGLGVTCRRRPEILNVLKESSLTLWSSLVVSVGVATLKEPSVVSEKASQSFMAFVEEGCSADSVIQLWMTMVASLKIWLVT